MRVFLVIAIVAQAVLAQTETAQMASISGTLVDVKTLKPIPAAIVAASRVGVPPFKRSTRSGGDGAFIIRGLTAGNYQVCVQAQGDEYLDPCDWNGAAVGIVLAAGEASSSIKIPLSRASVLQVQIMDEQGAMGQLTKDGRQPDLSVGVWGPRGLYYPARAESRAVHQGGPEVDTRVHHYRLAVPRDTTLKLHVASTDLELGDADGVALPANASPQAFQHATGDANPKSFQFKVLGPSRR